MELVAIGTLVLIGWVWYACMKAREICHEAARDMCKRMGVELVDDTVALSYLGLRRDGGGRLVLRRVYEFRYVGNDWIVQQGAMILNGYTLEACMVHVLQTSH
ncbi:MAG: DUF3301 domain-containing protein [Magnetococcales bacterium]|nr:DUF3301 domain-containing protein [Magnetococcales bacterium]